MTGQCRRAAPAAPGGEPRTWRHLPATRSLTGQQGASRAARLPASSLPHRHAPCGLQPWPPPGHTLGTWEQTRNQTGDRPAPKSHGAEMRPGSFLKQTDNWPQGLVRVLGAGQ